MVFYIGCWCLSEYVQDCIPCRELIRGTSLANFQHVCVVPTATFSGCVGLHNVATWQCWEQQRNSADVASTSPHWPYGTLLLITFARLQTPRQFCCGLETHLFQQAYNLWGPNCLSWFNQSELNWTKFRAHLIYLWKLYIDCNFQQFGNSRPILEVRGNFTSGNGSGTSVTYMHCLATYNVCLHLWRCSYLTIIMYRLKWLWML